MIEKQNLNYINLLNLIVFDTVNRNLSINYKIYDPYHFTEQILDLITKNY